MSDARFGLRRGRRKLQTNNKDSEQLLRKHRPDYKLLVLMTALLVLGAVTIYSISPGVTALKGLSENFYNYKQLVAISLGFIAFIAASFMNIRFWKRLEIPLIVFAAIVAVSVRAFGAPINGAYRWLDIGGMSFQAAELIKFALIVWLAGFLARARINNTISNSSTLKMVGAVGLIIIVVVAGLQSDLGSAGVMIAIIGFMSFVAGMSMKKLILVSGIVIILLGLAIISSPYRRERVSTFLNPTADCQNEGYQACQALITVGSGGLVGRGLGKSVQAYGYLPEAANDSIFAIIAEKFGFLGTTITIIMFLWLFKRIKMVAEYAPNDYSRLLISGILTWLSVQMIINVGAMIGLLPLKGITLPFVSYGGTSIIFVMMAVGLVFQVSRYTDLAMYEGSTKAPRVHRMKSSGPVVRRIWSRSR